MRAVVRHNNRLSLADVASPVPGAGQALLATLACGICGSDLHALHHLGEMMDAEREMGSALHADCSKPIIFGHEFCGEVLDYGPATEKRLRAGTRVVAVPLMLDAKGVSVRRQNIWHNSRRKLAECGPRQGLDFKRRACGVASADIRWSVV